VLARCRELGFQYFQGFFFCKPEMVQSRRLPASRLNYLRFLQAINQNETEVSEVEKLIRQEVSLSYKLLRYLNTAAFGLRGGVKSIRHAITLLGQRPLRKWASLVAVSEMTDEKPAELMNTCLVRARCCELLAECRPAGAPSSDLFMLGMFSLLDAMLDRPIDELVNELALPGEIRTALTDETAELRPFIELLIGFERGHWEAIAQAVQALGLQSDAVYQCYRDALVWSHEIMRELSGMNNGTSKGTRAA
jgi:c-di-GMP-related signal transduction protein